MPHTALPPAEDLGLRVLADIARGGMGVVQLCRAQRGRLAGRHVAVKRLIPAVEEDPEFVNMFLDETWITSNIQSPHVVKVEAWGRDDDGMFLAVELVQGVSLSRLLKESKEKQEPFAERTVANIMSQVCAGLAAAHELVGENGARLGLVHRDLTPGNILVGFDGVVRIADFGIAKAEERLTSTRIGMMKGKPAYMAPEQARGGSIDGRADLFSMGVMMYELLAGSKPFGGKNDLEMLVAVASEPSPDLAATRAVSSVFTDIVSRCLNKNPEGRPASANDVHRLLLAWRRERGFDSDDQQSLAAFVQRNTPEQRAWFNQALEGGLQTGGMTFSDLEARIDAGRRKASKATNPVIAKILARGQQAAAAAPAPQLDEIDDNAQTRFMQQSVAPAPAAGGQLGSTVALSENDARRAAATLATPRAPKATELPLPPGRLPFGPPSSGPGPTSPPLASAPSSPGPPSLPLPPSRTPDISQASFPSSGFPAQSGPHSAAVHTPLPHSAPSGQDWAGGQSWQAPQVVDVVARPTPPKASGSLGWVVLLVALTVGALAGGAWFVLRSRYGM